MADTYQHYKTGRSYALLGEATFPKDITRLRQVSTALYSEDPDTVLGLYINNDWYALHHLTGTTRADETLQYAIYQAQYDCGLGSRVIWARPHQMFFELVEKDGKLVPRFELVDEKESP